MTFRTAAGTERRPDWWKLEPLASYPEIDPHKTCSHRQYMSCDEYDLLLARSGGLCEICQQPPPTPVRWLSVDHDHKLGGWAVRGLVCARCNAQLKFIDAGTYELYGYKVTEDHMRYLRNPFHQRCP